MWVVCRLHPSARSPAFIFRLPIAGTQQVIEGFFRQVGEVRVDNLVIFPYCARASGSFCTTSRCPLQRSYYPTVSITRCSPLVLIGKIQPDMPAHVVKHFFILVYLKLLQKFLICNRLMPGNRSIQAGVYKTASLQAGSGFITIQNSFLYFRSVWRKPVLVN
jgi:hypothetical protein